MAAAVPPGGREVRHGSARLGSAWIGAARYGTLATLWHTSPACGMDWHGSAQHGAAQLVGKPRSRTPRYPRGSGSRYPRGSGSLCPAPRGGRAAPSAPAQGSPRFQQSRGLGSRSRSPGAGRCPVQGTLSGTGCRCTELSPPARRSALLQRYSGTVSDTEGLAQVCVWGVAGAFESFAVGNRVGLWMGLGWLPSYTPVTSGKRKRCARV